MDGRERVTRTLQFVNPDRVPRDLWQVPAVEMFRRDELEAVRARFPLDVAFPTSATSYGSRGSEEGRRPAGFRYGASERARGTPYVGDYTDEWGCPFRTGEPGVQGEVKHPPLADWSALDHWTPPWEILNGADWDAASRYCAGTTKFVLSPTLCNPFERMQWLRGTQALFIDLGLGSPEVRRLLARVNEFFLKEIERWCRTDVDGIKFQDDWGSQQSLLISPAMWREIFKPLYAEYCRMIHAAGKFAFMHSDGNIAAILPDLIEIGVDAINSQLFCMDIEALGRQYKGQITFWGEMDRQRLLPFGRPDEVRRAVRRVREALAAPAGGVIAQCEWGKNDPRQNVEAVFQAWEDQFGNPAGWDQTI